MQGYFYAIIPSLALIIHLIINYSVLHPENTISKKESHRNYRRFLISVLFYFWVDIMWGIVAGLNNITLLFWETSLYNIALAATIYTESRYVIAYLNLNDWFGKFIKKAATVFLYVQTVVVIINFFTPVLFYFDERGAYQVCPYRNWLIIFHFFIFTILAYKTFNANLKAEGRGKKRNRAVCYFAVTTFLSAILQFLFPLIPAYSLGFLIGICFLNSFVYFDEREEQMEIMQEYKTYTKEFTDIMGHAGFGTWKIIFEEEQKPRMKGNQHNMEFLATNKKYSEEELFDLWYKHIDPSSLSDVKKLLDTILSGQFGESTYLWHHPKKGARYLRAGGTIRKQENGISVLSGYYVDVTDIVYKDKERERELLEARRVAEESNRAKSAFLFNMSHDIRTPMNAIIGYTELIKRNLEDRDKCLGYFEKLSMSSDFLLTLINNVLSIARIESGKEKVDESIASTQVIFKNMYAIFSGTIEQKHLNLARSNNVETEYVYTDVVKVKEIFLNILSNACKYTPDGGNIVVIFREIASDKAGYTNIHGIVADNGIGMSKKYQEIIFEEFSREHNQTENKIQGTGLGMPLVKKYVDMLGGTITIDSDLGKGTTIAVTIPCRIAKNPKGYKKVTSNQVTSNQVTSNQVTSNQVTPLTILIAEDNDLNAEIIMEILKEFDIKTERAEDGVKCIDMLRKHPAGYYDAILMDIQMPNMDGYKATRVIRRLQDPEKAKIHILAMTANAFEEDVQNAFDAGMDGHLSKPIDVDAVLKELNKVREKNQKN